MSKLPISPNALIVCIAFTFASVGDASAHALAQRVVTATPSAPNVVSTPCAFFADMYPVSDASFSAHHATAKERAEVLHWSAKVAAQNQKYIRWMRMYGLLVFVANPGYYDRDGGYRPWMALNTNIIVDPVQCDAYAYPTA